jgi:hypothetical protein
MAHGKKHGGRPAGVSPAMSPPQVNVPPAVKCPKCGCTERTEYIPGSKSVQVYEGILPDGTRYNRIIRRRCRCLNPDCRQMRVERAYAWVKD